MTNSVSDTLDLDSEAAADRSYEESCEEPRMNFVMTIVLLAATTTVCTHLHHGTHSEILATQLVAITGGYLIDSIDSLTLGHNITKEFIAVILFPIIGNAARIPSMQNILPLRFLFVTLLCCRACHHHR